MIFDLKNFSNTICWVIYASGFKHAILQAKFPEIRRAFKEFEPSALYRMRSVKPVLGIFDNERKANCFLSGAQAIIKEGFSPFKQRLRKGGAETLATLPGIGPITKDHLAKNIGLSDVAKADIWLKRAADICNASSVSEITSYLAQELNESQHVIDVAVWTLGKDNLLIAG